MSQQTLPPRSGYAEMPHAYDPVAQRRLFDGVLGQGLMGLELRVWFGGEVTPIVAAFHALLFWLSLTIFFPILLWPLFDSRKRCLHDILAGVVVINRV